MVINTLKFTSLQNKIFRILCIKAEQKLNQRELARIIKVTPSGIAKALKELEHSKLIKIDKSRSLNLSYICLNRDQKVLKLKQIENLKQIYESELTEYLEEKYPGTTIILFGSYMRGEDISTSDIDIAIIGSKGQLASMKKFEQKLERKININYYSSFKEIMKELKENLYNGIVLSGAITL